MGPLAMSKTCASGPPELQGISRNRNTEGKTLTAGQKKAQLQEIRVELEQTGWGPAK